MKKIISLVLFLLIEQTSWANDWFPQQPDIEAPNTQPKEIPQQDKGQMVLLRAPCSEYSKMLETAKKYDEELLFTATGLTFSAQFGQPYSGALFFFVNQDKGSYTVLQVFGDGMACMLVNGRNFQPYTGDKK